MYFLPFHIINGTAINKIVYYNLNLYMIIYKDKLLEITSHTKVLDYF